MTYDMGENIEYALLYFYHDLGFPEHLTFDGAISQVWINAFFNKTKREFIIRYHI